MSVQKLYRVVCEASDRRAVDCRWWGDVAADHIAARRAARAKGWVRRYGAGENPRGWADICDRCVAAELADAHKLHVAGEEGRL